MRHSVPLKDIQFLILACVCETYRMTGQGPTAVKIFIDLGNVYNTRPGAAKFTGILIRLTQSHVFYDPFTGRHTPTAAGEYFFSKIAPLIIPPCPTVSPSQILTHKRALHSKLSVA